MQLEGVAAATIFKPSCGTLLYDSPARVQLIQTADKKQAQRGSGLPRVIQTVKGKEDSSSLKHIAWVPTLHGNTKGTRKGGKGFREEVTSES